MTSVYTVAFSGTKFLMVRNPKRNGWEMPGGRIEKNEGVKDAAVREYMEEAGHEIEIVSINEITDGCCVCAAVLGERTGGSEFASELFSELPEELAFGRAEYDGVLEWARSVIEKMNAR